MMHESASISVSPNATDSAKFKIVGHNQFKIVDEESSIWTGLRARAQYIWMWIINNLCGMLIILFQSIMIMQWHRPT